MTITSQSPDEGFSLSGTIMRVIAMLANHLHTGLAKFFCKGSNNKCFRCCDLFGLYCNYSAIVV